MLDKIIAGKYRIDALVGSGGMANVYKAYDMQEGRIVAIKMLREEHREDAEFLRRFEREARAVLSLSHPNIVQSYDVGVDENGVSFIVLEYVEGMTLKRYISERKGLSAKEAVSIASQLLSALGHAHESGIIHRDIKPQNVLISDSGKKIKLADFGIARDADATTRTFAGTNVIGSVHYISPEQAKGDNVTAASDIYSCAIIVYEMLTGSVPFAGDNTVAVALKHLQEEMTPPAEVNPKISRALSDVVMKGAAKDTSVRYASAEEFMNDLNRALKEPHGRFAQIRRARKNEMELRRTTTPLVLKLAVGILAAMSVFVMVMFVNGFLHGSMGNGEALLVPSLEGKTLEEARSLAELRGFNLSVSDYVISSDHLAGHVIRQSPVNGVKGNEGDTIMVEISSGSGYSVVPNVTGLTIQEASLRLSEENLCVGSVSYDPTSTQPEGLIVGQEPAADTESPELEAVDIWVSGSDAVLLEMPAITGKDLETAMVMLKECGITQRVWFRFVTPEEGGQEELVVQQSPAAQIGIDRGSLAEVWVNRTDLGRYVADIAINLDVKDTEKLITVTTVLKDGMEIVLFEGKVQPGIQQPISFTGCIRESGEHECIIYEDGVRIKCITSNFRAR